MEAYINGMACIAHHNVIDDQYFFEDVAEMPASNNLMAKEPDYKAYIPAALIRRMSHIVKMGVSAAMMSMKKAGLSQIDAIITGTGMGCAEDTDKFLRSVVYDNESMLTPTSFIKSTHNTVAGQIALLMNCSGCNFTYVHQNLSFEYAAMDAMMLLMEGDAENVLVGGIDENTPTMYELFRRHGLIKLHENLQPIWQTNTSGYVVGEGAAFFNLSDKPADNCRAKIAGVKCLQELAGSASLLQRVTDFLTESLTMLSDIDLVLSGNCGDAEMDKRIAAFNTDCERPIGYYKHLCGDYFTASSFAVWLAARIIDLQQAPKVIVPNHTIKEPIKNILIVNHYQDKQYSFLLVSAR